MQSFSRSQSRVLTRLKRAKLFKLPSLFFSITVMNPIYDILIKPSLFRSVPIPQEQESTESFSERPINPLK